MGKKHGKRFRAAFEKVLDGPVAVGEAVRVLKEFTQTKFDQTVELVLWLGIDPKQADQAIRGSISLPNGIGKTKRVVAFCEGEQAEAAKSAGAIEAGVDELIEKIQKGWTDFDVAVATPAVMRSVSKLGRILGPQGKMPSPKAGTVRDDVPEAVKEYAAGKLDRLGRRFDRIRDVRVTFAGKSPPRSVSVRVGLTRGKPVTKELLHDFVKTLDIPDDAKQRLLDLTPATYTGLASSLARIDG